MGVRVSIEVATRNSWGDFIGLDGEHVGLSTFGSSAPIKQLHRDFGLTVEHVHVYRCACPLWSSGFLSTRNFREHARNYLSTHSQFSCSQLSFCLCWSMQSLGCS